MGLYISASGMLNALRRNDVTANNVANWRTAGYQTVRASSAESSGGGVHIGAISRGAEAGPLDTASPDWGEVRGVSDLPYFPEVSQASTVDLATEQVNQILDLRAFEANLSAFNAQDDALGGLLDLAE